MDSLSLLSPPLSFTEEKNHHDGSGSSGVLFDSSLLKKQANIPKQFIWPRAERPGTLQVLRTPVVDLAGFFKSDEASKQHSARLVGEACSAHGVFQVINHGVSAALCQDTFQFIDHFFKLPSERKLRARRRPGSTWGYAGAHADRFTSRLPWKETLSFGYGHGESERVAEYFASVLGQDFERMGLVYQRYSEAMFELGLAIMELLGMSSGVGGAYREFFEDGSCIMRCNYYPPCQEPELVLGTGPHCDPTALTILQQDQVPGLEVFAEGKWQSVRPVRGAMVVNIGDTFMALTNGRYKSCLHRAVVNPLRERKSLAFFLCPKDNKIVKPPSNLEVSLVERIYPDFKWSDLLEFTQMHYRADITTLESFSNWIQSIEIGSKAESRPNP